MRRIQLVIASITVAAIPLGCAPYMSSGANTAATDRVIDEAQIAEGRQPNVWVFLQDNAHQYYFVEDVAGRAIAIHSLRGQSSIALTSSDVPMVIVDGARLIDYDLLQQMPLEAVERIELMGGARGTSLEGTNAGSGVIYIHTRFASSRQESDHYSAGLRLQPGTVVEN
jgi:hypothetical protein